MYFVHVVFACIHAAGDLAEHVRREVRPSDPVHGGAASRCRRQQLRWRVVWVGDIYGPLDRWTEPSNLQPTKFEPIAIMGLRVSPCRGRSPAAGARRSQNSYIVCIILLKKIIYTFRVRYINETRSVSYRVMKVKRCPGLITDQWKIRPNDTPLKANALERKGVPNATPCSTAASTSDTPLILSFLKRKRYTPYYFNPQRKS